MAEKIIIPNTWCTPLTDTEPRVAEYPDCVRYDFCSPIFLGEVSNKPLAMILYLMHNKVGSLSYNTFLPFEDETSFRITSDEFIPEIWSERAEKLCGIRISPKLPHGYFYGSIHGFEENGLLIEMDDPVEWRQGHKRRMPNEIENYLKRLRLTIEARGKIFDCYPSVSYEGVDFLSDSFVTERGRPIWRGAENLSWLHACGDQVGLPLDPRYHPDVDIMIREESLF